MRSETENRRRCLLRWAFVLDECPHFFDNWIVPGIFWPTDGSLVELRSSGLLLLLLLLLLGLGRCCAVVLESGIRGRQGWRRLRLGYRMRFRFRQRCGGHSRRPGRPRQGRGPGGHGACHGGIVGRGAPHCLLESTQGGCSIQEVSVFDEFWKKWKKSHWKLNAFTYTLFNDRTLHSKNILRMQDYAKIINSKWYLCVCLRPLNMNENKGGFRDPCRKKMDFTYLFILKLNNLKCIFRHF